MAYKHISRDDALDRMQRHHTGLKHPHVGVVPFAFVEIDHLGKAEQIAAYEALAVATGLRWCLWVSSGGKSVHAYLRFTEPLTADDPLREQIQRLLIVILQGDTQIVNVGRLMRLPGYTGEERPQPVLHLDADARYDATDVRDRLAAYAKAMGIEDIDRAFEVLRLAERLEQMAKPSKVDEGRIGTEEAMELLALAGDLRAHLADPDERDLRAARFALRRTAQVSGPKVVPVSPGLPGDAIRLTKEQADLYRTMAPETVVPAPCCAEHPDPKGYLFKPVHGRVRGYCNRHGVSFYEVEDTSTGAGTLEGVDWITTQDRDLGSEDIDAYLDSLGIGTGEPEPEPDDPGRPVWMRDTGDPLIDEANRIARRLEFRRDGPPVRAEVEAVAEALTDLAERSNLDNRAFPHGGALRRDQQSHGENSKEKRASSHDGLSDEEIDAAVEHYARLGGSPIFCSRGRNSTIASGGPSAITIRLPCKAFGCTVCAPRKMIALQAAATVILGDEGIGARWETVVFDCPSSGGAWVNIRKQLSSWALERGDRHHLIYGIRPGTNRVHLVHRQTDDPRTRRGLRFTFIEFEATIHSDVASAVVDTIGRVDLDAWRNDKRRNYIDRGGSMMQARITALHKEVIGAAASKLTAAERRKRRETRVVLLMNEPVDAIRFAAEKAMGGAATEADPVAVDVRSRRAFTRWRFEDHEVDARVALQRVKDAMPPRVAQATSEDPETDADPISTLSLFGCEGTHGFIELDIRRTG